MLFGKYRSSFLLIAGIAFARLTSAEQTIAFRFTDADLKLLREANDLDGHFEKRGLVLHDPEVESYLNSVATRLIAGVPALENVAFRFRVIRDPMVNAFALPNGSIYVNSGLIAAVGDEAQLAAVLSHEITHVTNRHTYVMNRSIRKKVMTLNVLQLAAAGGSYFPGFGAAVGALASVSEVIVVATVYGYSRELETEADRAGLVRLAGAHYDDTAMGRALQSLDERLEFEPIEPFWRTHPHLRDRIKYAEAHAGSQDPASIHRVNTSDYLAHMEGVIRYNISLDLESRRARTALARATRLAEWEQQDARDRTLQADAYRSLGAKKPRPDDEELTHRGQSADRKRFLKRTAEEEEQELLAKPNGPSIRDENRATAEKLYREVIADRPAFADPHRGLAMLLEDESKSPEALHEYQEYLRLAPDKATDRVRIETRIQRLIRTTSQKDAK